MSGLKDRPTKKVAWIALATGAALIASFAAHNLIEATWRVARDDDPPTNPAARDTAWHESLAWTLLTGVGAGLARLFARRGAATVWQNVTGSRPPAVHR